MEKGKERKISMSDDSMSVGGSLEPELPRKRCVRFHPVVQVAMLPWQERPEARKARKGLWKPAPLSDELWDGEYMVFRAEELTPEAFKRIAAGSKGRRKTPLPRTFARMFSLAVTEDGELATTEMVQARARVYAEDFDEDERDSDGRLGSTDDSDDTHVVLKLSAETFGNDLVLRFEEDPDGRKSPLPPKPIAKRPSGGDKLAKFIPVPPSDPSPSERLRGSSLATPQLQLARKKVSSSAVPYQNGPAFVCGDGTRPLFYMWDVPLRDEPTWLPPPRVPSPSESLSPSVKAPKKPLRERSFIGIMLGSMFHSHAPASSTVA